MVGSNRNRATSRLARVVGAVQRAPARTAIGASLLRQVMVDVQQQREELRVVQDGMAHCDGLSSWSKRDSPTAAVCSRSLREIFYRPSPNLINSGVRDIGIRARAQKDIVATSGPLGLRQIAGFHDQVLSGTYRRP